MHVVWICVKKRGKGGKSGRKNLDCGAVSRKKWSERWGVLQPKMPIGGVLHLVGMGLCSVIELQD